MTRTEVLERKQKWFAIAGAVVIALLLAASFGLGLIAQKRADTAEANAQNLAEQVQQACASGGLIVGDRDLCQRANEVRQSPAETIAGPPGEQGPPGVDGITGPRGISGPRGPDGEDGADGKTGPAGADGEQGPAGPSGEPGPPGDDGEDGKTGPAGADGEQGPPGPAGPPGADGSTGPAGPAGKTGPAGSTGAGIRSVQCVGTGDGSYWAVTLTDGTTQTSAGPCRLATKPGNGKG